MPSRSEIRARVKKLPGGPPPSDFWEGKGRGGKGREWNGMEGREGKVVLNLKDEQGLYLLAGIVILKYFR